MKRAIWPILFWTALLSFTAYMALDTFVIKRVGQTNATQSNTSMFETESGNEATSDETSGRNTEATLATRETGSESAATTESETTTAEITTETETTAEETTETTAVSVNVSEYYEYDTHIYVADIIVPSAEYIRTAFADDTYGRHVTEVTSEIAADHDALIAINGDYYGAQETGYVIRNGIVYRSTGSDEEILCLYADGNMAVVNSSDYTADELVEQGVWQAFTFGPGLIEENEIAVTTDSEVSAHMSSNPRTAIGMIEKGHYVFVVADGRTSTDAGLSLYQLATFMKELGCSVAYNLDGGGSSTMYYKGEVINTPTADGWEIKERAVSDIVYISESL